jgi:uncharacterized protein YoxC
VRGSLAITAGDWAALIFSLFWALLVVVLSGMILNFLRVVTSLKGLVDGITQETVPLLHEVGTTVRSVNKEIERVDSIIGSVQQVAANAATVSETVKTAVSNPLVKAIAFLAGARRATKKFREG